MFSTILTVIMGKKYRFSQNSVPKISKFAMERDRPSSKYFRYVGTIEVDVDDLLFSENDPRAIEGTDPEHVQDIKTNLETAGYDEDGELTSVMLSDSNEGKYEIIDNHHLIDAIKQMNQKKWIVDLYEYTGCYGTAHKWAAATELGFSINNNHNIVKKTTMASVIAAGLKKIERCGYINEPGTPVDHDNINAWFVTCGHDKVFASNTLPKITKQILNPTKLTGKKIRPLSKEKIDQLCADSNGLFGEGPIDNDRHGFVVCTNTYAADAPKGYNQMVNVLTKGKKPVFITYSTKDDAKKIVDNHSNYFDKLYETHVKHVNFLPNFYPVALTPLSKEDFLAKIEMVAIGQIDGEYNETDFIERK